MNLCFSPHQAVQASSCLLVFLLLSVCSFSSSLRQSESRVWDGMVQNFGYRWEGRTYGYYPQTGDKEGELASVYQLEFPQGGKTGLGTWSGWNVFRQGDQRKVPLSRDTCINRTQGTSTFQFVLGKVGGRCPVVFGTPVEAPPAAEMKTPPNREMFEINFFHGGFRRGVVVTYTLKENGSDLCYCLSDRILIMNFRRASGGYREDGEMEEKSANLASVTAQNEGDVDLSLQPHTMYALSVKDYQECKVSDSEDGDWKEEGNSLIFCPEGLFLCLPRSVPATTDEAESSSGTRFQFGCDFRKDGGPVKVLTANYDEEKRLLGWDLKETS